MTVPAPHTATPKPEGPPDSSLRELTAELEAQRRAANAGYVRGWLRFFSCVVAALAPFALVGWSAAEIPAGAGEPTLRAQVRTLFASLPPQAVGLGLVAWPALWIAGGAFAFRREALAPRAAYVRDFKARVFAAVCKEHFPGIRYEPGEGIHWRVVDESGLFAHDSDVYTSEDRFSGRCGDTEVCFAEAVAQVEKRRGFGKDRETVYETYFRGIVFIADFNKHFHATIRLVPRDAKAASAPGEERVRLEDPRFEALFQTSATDATNARYVLSPALMERLAALNARHHGLRARFHAGRLLLLLPASGDRFEPSLDRRADDTGQITSFVSQVRSCLAVVDALNLNTRIWTKR